MINEQSLLPAKNNMKDDQNHALFAGKLHVHGKITSKEHSSMHLLQKEKQKILNKQGSYKGL